MKILQLFERVWKTCPAVSALDRNIGYLERGYTISRLMRDHLEGDEWLARFIDGKSSEEQVVEMFDAILAREPTPQEISWHTYWIKFYDNKTIPTERNILGSQEHYERFRAHNIVPGCGRAEINCTWIRKRNLFFLQSNLIKIRKYFARLWKGRNKLHLDS